MGRNRTSPPSPVDPSTPQQGSSSTENRPCATNRPLIEAAFALYPQKLRGTICNVLGPCCQDVDDVLHNAFVALLEHTLPIPDGTPAAQRKWFCAYVRRIALSQRRSTAVRARSDDRTLYRIREGFSLQPIGPFFTDPGTLLEIQRILNALPDAQRTLIEQVCVLGVRPSALALASGKGDSTIRYLLDRALEAVAALARGTEPPSAPGVSKSDRVTAKSTPLKTFYARSPRQASARRTPGA